MPFRCSAIRKIGQIVRVYGGIPASDLSSVGIVPVSNLATVQSKQNAVGMVEPDGAAITLDGTSLKFDEQ